jgi:hypothetical protein
MNRIDSTSAVTEPAPSSEAELYARIVAMNRDAYHHRDLESGYGYNSILGVNLVSVCLGLRRRIKPPIRILDVGCGDGFAMNQLAGALERSGAAPGDFECWGMGLNRYDDMWIPPARHIESGLNAFQTTGMEFHLIVSVFTFHYLWHKLEGIEKLYNELLADGGRASIHFPGYLVRFGESAAALTQGEADGNARFSQFLARQEKQGNSAPMDFRLVPYYSDDDDCALLATFGTLHFEKKNKAVIDFGQSLKAFALFTHGFNFERMNISPLTYIASHYSSGPSRSMTKPPYSITSIPASRRGSKFRIDIAVHALDSESVVLICPGAREPLSGGVVDYAEVAEQIRNAGLGAAIRYGDPFDGTSDYPDKLLMVLRRVIEYALETAHHYCATATPRLRVMAYSSSAGAIAALASDFECIDSILLIAPSSDVPRLKMLPQYAQFEGEVRVMTGENDHVVLPRQAFWFYENARAARIRDYVEVPSCGHDFEGSANKSIFIRSPIWAFGNADPKGFPASRSAPTDLH